MHGELVFLDPGPSAYHLTASTWEIRAVGTNGSFKGQCAGRWEVLSPKQTVLENTDLCKGFCGQGQEVQGTLGRERGCRGHWVGEGGTVGNRQEWCVCLVGPLS